MTFQPANTASLVIFCIFSLLMAFGIYKVFMKHGVPKNFMLVFFCTTIVFSALGIFGVLQSHFLPLVPIFMASLVISALAFGMGRPGQTLSKNLSLKFLILMHFFRLPLELLLHHWAATKVIPETMTWSGQNYDIITGVVAILLAPLAEKHKIFPWIFQLIGASLLLNVLRVVVMSLPLPFSWSLDIPLQLPMQFPYLLIGPLFVWPALLGHIVLFRKLLTTQKNGVGYLANQKSKALNCG